MPPGVGDRQPVMGMIGDAAHHRIIDAAIREADDAGGEGKQAEQPDHGEKRQQAKDIGLRLGAADGHQHDRHRDNAGGHQEHQEDAAAPPRRFVGPNGSEGRSWSVSAVIWGGAACRPHYNALAARGPSSA